jgi:hypothetical protein
MNTVFEKPFSGFTFFTFLINVIPFGCGIFYAVTSLDNDCEKNVPLWLLVQCLLFLANIAMALYLFSIFSQPYNPNDNKNVNFGNRLSEVVCNNPIVALYIILGVFIIVWQFVGATWINATHSADCAPNMDVFKYAKIAATCMRVFIIVGACIFVYTGCVNSCQTGHCCEFAPAPTTYHNGQHG